MNSVYLNTEI